MFYRLSKVGLPVDFIRREIKSDHWRTANYAAYNVTMYI